MKNKLFLLVIALLCTLSAFSSCEKQKQADVSGNVVGIWCAANDVIKNGSTDHYVSLVEFKSNGIYVADFRSGTFEEAQKNLESYFGSDLYHSDSYRASNGIVHMEGNGVEYIGKEGWREYYQELLIDGDELRIKNGPGVFRKIK